MSSRTDGTLNLIEFLLSQTEDKPNAEIDGSAFACPLGFDATQRNLATPAVEPQPAPQEEYFEATNGVPTE